MSSRCLQSITVLIIIIKPRSLFGFRSTTSMPTTSWTRRPWNQRRKEQLSASPVGLRTLPHPLISASWRKAWRKPRSIWHSNMCVEETIVIPLELKISKPLQRLSREAFSSVLAAENFLAFYPLSYYLFRCLSWSENFLYGICILTNSPQKCTTGKYCFF